MRTRPLLLTLALLGLLTPASFSRERRTPSVDVCALDGEWIFVEDRTEGRPPEQQQPSMSARVTIRIEDDAFVLVRSDGEIRVPLDGTPTEVVRSYGSSFYSGEWKDDTFAYQSKSERLLITWELRITDDGMLATAASDSFRSVALYRHPEDIELPEMAEATIEDIEWLAGDWVGVRGKSSIEERWTPALGGSMFGVSRTVRTESDRLTAFEYLRVAERDGGLVYVAQPGGRPPTSFLLTELSATRAVFENPRHDFPQRIVYELGDDGGLTASIGFGKGGKPQAFEFEREE